MAEITLERNMEAQSTFAASTLVPDLEKSRPVQKTPSNPEYTTIYGSIINAPQSHPGSDATYAAKAQLLNHALLDLGMGRYQWFLFAITSIGWFLDSFWMNSFVIIGPAAANEAQFFFTGDKAPYLFISLFVGLAVGAAGWAWMSDNLGRKTIFTSTLVLLGMGGLVGAGMPSFTGLCVVGFVVGLAIAGNQLVDAMILVETVPASQQFLLCLQGAFWGLGQLVSSAVGWAFIAIYTCGTGPDEVSTSESFSHSRRYSSYGSEGDDSSDSSCHYVSNKGWRYIWWTFGCITLFLYLCRFFFPLAETPKFLLARRRDAEATQLVKDTAAYNKSQTWLTESSFARIDSTIDTSAADSRRKSRTQSIIQSLGPVGLPVLLLLWAATGLTFILHQTYISNYLAGRGVAAVNPQSVVTDYLFSRYLYLGISAIPGPIIAAFLIEVKFLGRKRTGSIIAILTGLFMLLSTLARSRNSALAFECVLSFLHSGGLAVLTVYTVELLPSPVRGSGLAVMGFTFGLFGLIAHIITAFVGDAVAGGGPVWFCGAFWVVMGAAWHTLPVETHAMAAA